MEKKGLQKTRKVRYVDDNSVGDSQSAILKSSQLKGIITKEIVDILGYRPIGILELLSGFQFIDCPS